MIYQPVFVFVHEVLEGAAMMQRILALRVSARIATCESIVTADQDDAIRQAAAIVESSFRAGQAMTTVRFMVVSTPLFRRTDGSIVRLGDYLNAFNRRVSGRVSTCAVFSSQHGDIRQVQASQANELPGVEIFYLDPSWLPPFAKPLEHAIRTFVKEKRGGGA